MEQLIEILNSYESLIQSIGIVVTIIGFIVGTNTISHSIRASFSNANINEVNINTATEDSVGQKMFEAQTYYRAGDYGNAMRIYQMIQNESAVAKSNIGFLYAHGLGVEQSTRIASEYYKKAYEMGCKQALQNYVSINLAMPFGYAKTLEALKYGYDQGDETAIRYLAACLRGKMPDVPSDELKKMADKFMSLNTDIQLRNLKSILQFVKSEIVFFPEGNLPENTEFVKYAKLMAQPVVNRKIIDYVPITDPETNETCIVPLNSTAKVYVYWKKEYSFYLGQYCPADEFAL